MVYLGIRTSFLQRQKEALEPLRGSFSLIPEISSDATVGQAMKGSRMGKLTDGWTISDYLAVGLVILISIAIALGIIFLCVLIALVIALSTRNDDLSAYPLPLAPAYDPKYGHEPSPVSVAAEKGKIKSSTGVLETLGVATAALSAGHPQGGIEPNGVAQERNQSRSSRANTSTEDDESFFDQRDMEEGDDSLPLRGVRYSFDAEKEEELSISTGDMVEVSPHPSALCRPEHPETINIFRYWTILTKIGTS